MVVVSLLTYEYASRFIRESSKTPVNLRSAHYHFSVFWVVSIITNLIGQAILEVFWYNV